MIKQLASLLSFALVLIALLPPGSGASTPSPAPMKVPLKVPFRFGPGERLTYEVTLDEANVGKADFEVIEKTKMAGRDVYHLVSKIRSNKWVSLFSRIDDQIDSYIDVEAGYSHRIKINKRRRKKEEEKTIDFDQVTHRAIQSKDDKQEVFEIPPNVQDFLSSLYFLRAQDRLEPGSTISLDLHQNEKNWPLDVHVLEKERVKTPAGTFNAIKVQASFPEGGLFKSSGDLFIWFSDDDRHVPVMLQSESKKGTFNAALSDQKEGAAHLTAGAF
jgi:hypothetical protein